MFLNVVKLEKVKLVTVEYGRTGNQSVDISDEKSKQLYFDIRKECEKYQIDLVCCNVSH